MPINFFDFALTNARREFGGRVNLDALDLPSLADQGRCATPKPTKLDRAQANKAADRADTLQLEAWRKEVRARDGLTDRLTGQKLKTALKLLPDRAECHHIEPRGNYDVRYDVRNGLMLAYETHFKVERNRLRIVGTQFFTVNGQQYIDATFPVTFEVVQ